MPNKRIHTIKNVEGNLLVKVEDINKDMVSFLKNLLITKEEWDPVD